MKKLYKLKDGAGKSGAVGSGLPIGKAGSSAIGGGLPKGLTEQNLWDKSVRPWIFDHSRRLRQANLKRHEIRYMDLTEREAQLIQHKEPSGNKDFLKSGQEMTADDSNGGIEVKPDLDPLVTEKLIMGALVGLGVSLLILLLF